MKRLSTESSRRDSGMASMFDRRIHHLFERLPYAVVFQDERGRITAANPAAKSWLGSVFSQLEGAIPPPGYLHLVTANQSAFPPEELFWRKALRDGAPASGTLGLLDPLTERCRWFAVRAVPIPKSGRDASRVATTFNEITEFYEASGALARERKRSETLLSCISDAHLSLTDDLVITAFNPAAEKILRRNQQEIVGRTLFDAFPEARGSEFEARFLNVLETRRPDAFEVYFTEEPYVDWYDVRVFPAAGGIDVFFQVTTARHHTEHAFRRIEWIVHPKEQRRLDQETFVQPYGSLDTLNTDRTILDAVGPEMLRETVREYLDLLDTSAAVYEKNGDYALGIFASGWCRFMDQASRRRCGTEDNRAALASGKWLCHESCWHAASKIAIATNAPVDVACHGGLRLYAVPIRAGNEVVGAMNFGYDTPPRERRVLRRIAAKYGVDVDTLEKKSREYRARPEYIVELAKRRLNTSALLIGAIVESRLREKQVADLSRFPNENPWPVLRVDRTGALFFANQASLKLLEVLQCVDNRITEPTVLENILETVAQNRSRGINVAVNGRIYTLFLVPIRETGYLNIYGADITEQTRAEDAVKRLNRELEQRVAKRTEELKAANRELESFAYTVSHDLRAPLRAINGFAHIIAEGHKRSLSEEGAHYFDNILEATDQMSRLIEDLLRYSRLGRRGVISEPVPLENVLNDVFKTLSTQIDKTRAIIRLGQTPPVLFADKTLIKQVLINLIDNAIKYRRENVPPEVDIEWRTVDKIATITIKDNGIGIDTRYHEKIFHVFQRLHSEGCFSGTGIGLAIVDKALALMNGRIRLESEKGVGSAFHIELPVAEGDHREEKVRR